MGGRDAVEVAKTVMEVAEIAWTAVECCHHHGNHHKDEESHDGKYLLDGDENQVLGRELESLRSENRYLRSLLEQNLRLLENLSESPALLQDCPPDASDFLFPQKLQLYARLVSTMNSKDFLTRLKSLSQASIDGAGNEFPFREATGEDLHSAEVLINVDHDQPSWWVWVTDDMVPSKVEERSGIDDENYVIITEEHVVDGVANFMAKCIVSNPKAQDLAPEELQKILAKEFGGRSKMEKLEKMVDIWHAGKMFYTLSTWGLALIGLYRSRGLLKLAAKGVHTTTKVVLKAL